MKLLHASWVRRTTYVSCLYVIFELVMPFIMEKGVESELALFFAYYGWPYLHFLTILVFGYKGFWVMWVVPIVVNLLLIYSIGAIIAVLCNRKALSTSWKNAIVVLLLQIAAVTCVQLYLHGSFLSRCEKLTGSHQRSCYDDVAVRTKDIALCKSKGTTDFCIRKMAVKHKNIDFCDALAGSRRSDCIAVVTEDGSLCTSAYCWSTVAKRTLDVDLCEKITRSSNGISRDSCIINIAVALRDESLCDLLEGRSRLGCISMSD
jgi:hypothetical protein